MKLELDIDAQMPLEQRRLLIIEDDLTQTVRGKSFLHRNRLVGKEAEMVEALVSGCGKEVVNDVLHYWVRWAETLEPEHSLGDAKEMVDKFEAWLSAKLEVKKGGSGFQPGQARGGRSQCFGWPTAEEAARSIPEHSQGVNNV